MAPKGVNTESGPQPYKLAKRKAAIATMISSNTALRGLNFGTDIVYNLNKELQVYTKSAIHVNTRRGIAIHFSIFCIGDIFGIGKQPYPAVHDFIFCIQVQ